MQYIGVALFTQKQCSEHVESNFFEFMRHIPKESNSSE